MKTLQERLENSRIFPELKKAFEETWGTSIPFQYIDDECLDSKADAFWLTDAFLHAENNKSREMTDKEVIKYFKENLLDIFDDPECASNYFCECCNTNYASEENILDRYKDLDPKYEFEIMNWCEDCQDKYIQEWT